MDLLKIHQEKTENSSKSEFICSVTTTGWFAHYVSSRARRGTECGQIREGVKSLLTAANLIEKCLNFQEPVSKIHTILQINNFAYTYSVLKCLQYCGCKDLLCTTGSGV